MSATTTLVACPVCGGDVNISEDIVANELIDCGECATELEVVSLDPLELAQAPEAAEDWGE